MFYDNYVRLCNSIGKSPTAVTVEIGLYRSAVTSWKNGTKPTAPTLRKIANYFGVTTDELLEEKEAEFTIVGDKVNHLLTLFAELNEQGQEKVIEYVDDLKKSGKYSKKGGQPGLGSKEA